MSEFAFNLLGEDGKARVGEIVMPRGTIRTPAFMPVGTAGTVKGMYANQVRELGADAVLGNTYHLMLRPGAERVAKLGGLHKFMNWPYPILTDSGGFQVMSLSGLRKLNENGVTFQSHIDGSKHVLTPERSIEIQLLLDSNIIMQLDECIKLPAEYSEIERAMQLSVRWANRSQQAFGTQSGRALFAIVQGGTEETLRRESAEALVNLNFEGYAIGGLAVGEPQSEMLRTIECTEPFLPKEKPRYLMGVGTPDDLLKCVARGIDMFDCVMPTRAGRHATAYSRFGKINFKNARHAEDHRPIDESSNCPASRDYSRAYLHHLTKSDEMLGQMLLTWNNLAYYQELMAGARKAINEGRYQDYMAQTQEGWLKGDLSPL
jgi:queuine tRNA-ribosyltransferase